MPGTDLQCFIFAVSTLDFICKCKYDNVCVCLLCRKIMQK